MKYSISYIRFWSVWVVFSSLLVVSVLYMKYRYSVSFSSTCLIALGFTAGSIVYLVAILKGKLSISKEVTWVVFTILSCVSVMFIIGVFNYNSNL